MSRFGTQSTADLRKGVREAMARGSQHIQDARQALATDPASSVNRRAAEAVAKRSNQAIIDAQVERFRATGKYTT